MTWSVRTTFLLHSSSWRNKDCWYNILNKVRSNYQASCILGWHKQMDLPDEQSYWVTFLSIHLKKHRSIELASFPNKGMFMTLHTDGWPWERNKPSTYFLISLRFSDNGLLLSFFLSFCSLPLKSLSPHLPFCRCHSFSTLPLLRSSMTQHPLIFHLYLSRLLLFPVSPPLLCLCHFLSASFSPLTKHFHNECSFTSPIFDLYKWSFSSLIIHFSRSFCHWLSLFSCLMYCCPTL